MSAGRRVVLDVVRELAEQLPSGLLTLAATAIENGKAGDWQDLRQRAQQAVAVPAARQALGRLIDVWQTSEPSLSPASVALALDAAGRTAEHLRRAQTLELVWTGPASDVALRHTGPALQQVINAAQQELLVVSYTVYDIPEIAQALVAAAGRNVRLRIVIESPEAAGGHIAYNALAAFGQQVQAHAEIYRWPPEQRPKHGDKLAALHAKCAVADQSIMLVSSANLTRYALNLNMELGMLVQGGAQPRQVALHFQQLIDAGVLIREH